MEFRKEYNCHSQHSIAHSVYPMPLPLIIKICKYEAHQLHSLEVNNKWNLSFLSQYVQAQ
jgi:hypothetical protein